MADVLPTNRRVRRVHTAHGSHIEPPLDKAWSDLDKLHWLGAVVEADTGVRIDVRPVGDRYPDRFTLNVRGRHGSSFSSSYRYSDAWMYLSGVHDGAEATGGLEAGG